MNWDWIDWSLETIIFIVLIILLIITVIIGVEVSIRDKQHRIEKTKTLEQIRNDLEEIKNILNQYISEGK